MQEQLNYIEYFLDNEYKIIRSEEAVTSDIYRAYNQLQKTADPNIKEQLIKDIYSQIKIVEFKYGGEYDAVKNFPQYNGLVDTIDYLDQIEDVDIRLKKLDQIENSKYEIIREVKSLDNVSINSNPDIQNDVLYSINNMFENNKDILTNEELYELCTEYYKLKKDDNYLNKAQKNVSQINDKVWKRSLTDPASFQNGQNFKFLIHNFSAGSSFEKQIAAMQEFRDGRISCSLIGNDFIGTYEDYGRRAGFIYQYNSNIIASGKQDLGSIEGEEAHIVHKEYASPSLTADFLIEAGKIKANEKGEDFDYSTQYNEVLISSEKPQAIYIIGYGEKYLNSDYEKLQEMSERMGLPFVEIDMTLYRAKQGLDPLGKKGREYITENVIKSYFNLTVVHNDIEKEQLKNICDLYLEDVSNAYINLKSNNNLNKDNMLLVVDEIIKAKELDDIAKEIKQDLDSRIR